MGALISFLFATVFSPADQFRRMRQQPHPGAGFEAVLLMGVALGLFDLYLWREGHFPSVKGGPVPDGDFYLHQAMYVVPVVLVSWALYVMVARMLAGLLGGKGSSRAMMGALGLAFAVPVLVAFILPDIVVYARKGHGAMGGMMKYYAPVCLLWLIALGTVAVKEVEGIGGERAFVVAALALMAALGPVALFIR